MVLSSSQRWAVCAAIVIIFGGCQSPTPATDPPTASDSPETTAPLRTGTTSGVRGDASYAMSKEPVPDIDETIEITQAELQAGAEDLQHVITSKAEQTTQTAQKIADSIALTAEMNKQQVAAWIQKQNAQIDTRLMQLKQSIDQLPQDSDTVARRLDHQLTQRRQELADTVQQFEESESLNLEELKAQLAHNYDQLKAAIDEAAREIDSLSR
jgi:small-conductance mechanosensitive channel